MLSTYGMRSGLDRETALKLGAGFGSGMGMGETCGAVTGALMVIGLLQSRGKVPGIFSREQAVDAAREFVEQFTARNGTTICRELLGCDVGTPEGLKVAKRERHFKKRCPKFVSDAVDLLDKIGGE